jgi:hypothetical protein
MHPCISTHIDILSNIPQFSTLLLLLAQRTAQNLTFESSILNIAVIRNHSNKES